MVLESLLELVETLRARIDEHGALLSQNEMRTRYALIDPLLRELGWDTSNPSEVVVEDGSGDGRADYLLLAEGNPLMIIEAKRLGLGVQGGRQQAVNYAMDPGRRARYFTVSDGNQWEIYDTRKPAFDMMLLSFELRRASSSEVCLQAMALWRPSAIEGRVTAAESPITETVPQEESETTERQPTANTPSPTSSESTKRMRLSDFKEQITAFKQQVPEPAPTPQTQPATRTTPMSVPATDEQRWIPLPRLYPKPYSKPAELLLPDKSRVPITKWASLTSETARWLINNGYLKSEDCPVKPTENSPVQYLVATEPVHSNGREFNNYVEIADRSGDNLYVFTGLGSSLHVRSNRYLISLFGQDPSQFKVRLR